MVLDDFLARVAEAPDAVAVQDGDLRLTYRSLAPHASGLAITLTERAVGPESVVAVYANRSAELVVGELAALLADAAYLPLDPAQPAARIRQLLELSGAGTVLSTGPLDVRTGMSTLHHRRRTHDTRHRHRASHLRHLPYGPRY